MYNSASGSCANFSKAVAANAKLAPCQNTIIVSKVQNVQKLQAATKHLPNSNFYKDRLLRSHEKTAAVRSYLTIFSWRGRISKQMDCCVALYAILSKLFVKYNTAILSRATVKRLFSLGKDVLKQKRSGLSGQ